jgi:hypothetical protein
MIELTGFLRPLYQELDGVSRLETVERIGAIARRLVPGPRELEFLVLFHPLGNWLDKVGNISRIVLAVRGVSEGELRQTAASIKRLDAPVTEAERTVAAAILIDGAGVRGFAERPARARREGRSITDVAREALEETAPPEWLDPRAAAWLRKRWSARARMARSVLDEGELVDLL